MTYTILLERGDDGGWSAMARDRPGPLLASGSREHVIAPAPGRSAESLAAMRDCAQRLPEPRYDAVNVVPAA